jgi:RNA polymerase sigma-70 factor (ECF subfamily)
VGTDRIRELGVRLAGAREDAFDDCYAELGPILRRYLRGRVPDADIDDVVQVVFVEVWRFRSRFDPSRSLEAWVLTIARRRAIDHLRSRRRDTVPLEDAQSMAGPDGRDIASQVERSADMQVALARLPDLQREAIEMAYYADLTQREIAERLHVPLGTIKARTARGLRRLGTLIVSPATILRSQRPGGGDTLAGRLARRDQRAVAHGFRGQDAKQVEVRRFLVIECAHLVPGAIGRAEDLEPFLGPQQADGAVGLLLQRVSRPRDRGQVSQFREDRPGGNPLFAGGPPAGRRRLPPAARRRRGRGAEHPVRAGHAAPAGQAVPIRPRCRSGPAARTPAPGVGR